MSFRTCHKLIRKVAQDAAGQLYEQLMKDNLIFGEWKRQHPGLSPLALERRFIAKSWGECIPFARGTLAVMLGRPDISEEMKIEIYEALQLDNSLVVGRRTPEEAVQIVNRGLLH